MTQPSRPSVNQFEVGQFFIHWMEWRAGDEIDEHTHQYDHVFMLAAGEIEYDGKKYAAPSAFNVPKGKLHGMRALTDAKGGCIHICRYPNGAVFPFGWHSEHQYHEAIGNL